jgi:hypothetical protein
VQGAVRANHEYTRRCVIRMQVIVQMFRHRVGVVSHQDPPLIFGPKKNCGIGGTSRQLREIPHADCVEGMNTADREDVRPGRNVAPIG